jgi:hypothetical protein
LIKLDTSAGFGLYPLDRFPAPANDAADGKLWNFDLNACTTALRFTFSQDPSNINRCFNPKAVFIPAAS